MQFVSMISTMAGRGSTNAEVHHTEGHCVRQIFMFMNILMTQHQMPVLFSYCGKKQDFYGSKRVTKKFKQAYQYDSSWKEAFLADLREMSHACQEEEEEGEERPREDPKLAFIQHRAMQPVPLLPYKLSGMNLKQAHTYLTELVRIDYWKRGGKDTKPVYKLLIWKPTWWPDHIWDWATIGCQFKEVPAKDLPHGKKKTPLIKEVIEYYLQSQNIDKNAHVEPNRNMKKEEIKISCRDRINARNAMVNEENQVEGGQDYVDDNDGGEKERTEDSDYADYAEEDDDDKEDDDDEDDDDQDDDDEDANSRNSQTTNDDVASVPDDSFSSISTLTLDAGEKNDDDDDYETPRRDKPEDLNRSATPEGQEDNLARVPRFMRTRSHNSNTGEPLNNDILSIFPRTGFERPGARGGRGRSKRGRGGRNR